MAHASSGSHDDAIPGQVKASTHVEAVAEGSESGVESTDGVIRLGAQEHPRRADAEDVGRTVILALINLIVADTLQATRTCRRKDTQFQQARAVPRQLFNTDGTHGLADGTRLNEFAQALRLGGGVIVEDPPPGFGSEGGTLSVRTADRVA